MADDGMLMNFAIDVDPVRPKPIFKGGRWRDRLQAKRSLRRRGGNNEKTQLPPGNATGPNSVEVVGKRRIEQGEEQDKHTVKRQKLSSKRDNTNSITQQSTKNTNRDVISSLFTSNPTSTTTTILKQNPNHPTGINNNQPIFPSNAPLSPAIHNFTSLGLSLSLSTNLQQTLSLTAPTAIQKAAIPQLLNVKTEGEEEEDSCDAFLQAETGSGKTLAYLLPIIQRLLNLTVFNPTSGQETPINRKTGLFALILAPTRELTHQITTVLTHLLSKFPHIVAGQVTGGATKNHEKARLRKGLNILVATPGRLVDHLENTKVLDLSQVKWLVLDEGDRLMEMGFEEEIQKVVEAFNKGRGRVMGPAEIGVEVDKVKGLPERRTSVLCSATMKVGVQRLGEMSLKNALLIKVNNSSDDRRAAVAAAAETAGGAATVSNEQAETPADVSKTGGDGPSEGASANGDTPPVKKQRPEKLFQAPAQLKQSYIIAPAKQRLVTLAALLKRTFARKGSVQKAIVFLSCADSVEFHFDVFARKTLGGELVLEASETKSNEKNHQHSHDDPSHPSLSHQEHKSKESSTSEPTPLPTISSTPTLTSPTNPSLTLYKLHGSQSQHLRTSTLDSFRRTTNPCILLCTDVASRGLDLPNIDLVIEYDPPFSGEEHLHRVGRTARAGKEGRAICFLMPGSEEGYVEVLKEGSVGGTGRNIVKSEGAEEVLRKGFVGQLPPSPLPLQQKSPNNDAKSDKRVAGGERRWDALATDWQLDVERWIIEDGQMAELARKAFVSHVRAYATHVAKERYMFDVKELHLGHLAKAFALREKPGSMGRGASNSGGGGRNENAKKRAKTSASLNDGDGRSAENQARKKLDPNGPSSQGLDAAQRMRAKVREQINSGADEFNIG